METISCYNCEEEFKVEPIFETEAEVCFCPYCGAELDIQEYEGELDELDDENNWN